jgi:hypothetical protein
MSLNGIIIYIIHLPQEEICLVVNENCVCCGDKMRVSVECIYGDF